MSAPFLLSNGTWLDQLTRVVAYWRRFETAQRRLGEQYIGRINIEYSLSIARSIAFGVLWIVVLIGDLRRRRIPIPVLLALMILSLLGQAWLWWLLAGAMLL